MHEVLVNRLGGLSLPRKSVGRLTDRPDMTLDVYHGHKTTTQQQIFRRVIMKSDQGLHCSCRYKGALSHDKIMPSALLGAFPLDNKAPTLNISVRN